MRDVPMGIHRNIDIEFHDSLREARDMDLVYRRSERIILWSLAVVGFFGVNGAFFYGLARPSVLQEALANPIALAFMGEAMLLMGALAFLLTKWRVSRLGWGWFVFLSLLGSMAFALPIVLLWRDRDVAS